IRLVLQTSKSCYRVGDLITITVYLENTSNKHFYVGSQLAEFNLFTQFQVMELKIVDEKNREVPRVLLFADPSPSELSRPIGEKLANNYV
ncbi:hypothetical protein, partial [Klebsiella pneumoniae]|uniref:hypothetical protein n=1 Tax=Klebsiella pneumoniae TaxID=573 RepID=UPI001D0F20DD